MEWLQKLCDGQGEEIAALHGELRSFRAEVKRLRAEVATWGHIWNDEALLAARVEALRDGTAQTC